jgi:uncharacterized protein (DUF111 family)
MLSELLILVQVDDATGETLQHAAQRMLAAGARNVQILGATTKKGRPGHVCLIDLPADREDEVAAVLAGELGAWGYRILESRHRHFDIRLQPRSVTVQTGAHTLAGEVRCKYVRNNGRLLAIKADHDDLVRLQQELERGGIVAPLRMLRAECERKAWLTPEAHALVLNV